MDFIKTSFSKERISIKPETIMAGYGGRISKGINDDLYVRNILFKNQDEIFILIQLDLLAIDYYFSDLIKENLKEKFNIKYENVNISCVHTHSAIGGIVNTKEPINKRYQKTFGDFDKYIAEEIICKIILCVEKCINSTENFTITYGKDVVEGICTDRNNMENEIDNLLQVLHIKTESNKQAVIYNFACHPTILEKSNDFISADFPGETSKFLEANNIALAMFYNGACGNISTRFTKRESSFNEVKRIGRELGENILNTANKYKENNLNFSNIKQTYKNILLNIKEKNTKENIENEILAIKNKIQNALDNNLDKNTIKPLYYELEGAKRNLELAESLKDIKTIEVGINVINFDNIYIVYIPGELFSSLGDKIKGAFKDKTILITCYSNGYIGYIPDEMAYENGCFEVMLTVLAKGEGEKLALEIIKQIQ
jgi:hypothetical protein